MASNNNIENKEEETILTVINTSNTSNSINTSNTINLNNDQNQNMNIAYINNQKLNLHHESIQQIHQIQPLIPKRITNINTNSNINNINSNSNYNNKSNQASQLLSRKRFRVSELLENNPTIKIPLQEDNPISFSVDKLPFMCVICLSDIDKDYYLKCGHIFHKECIKIWLSKNSTCPICKKKIGFNSVFNIDFDFILEADYLEIIETENNIVRCFKLITMFFMLLMMLVTFKICMYFGFT